MDRRKFLAVGAAALLAGCDSQNDGTDTPGDGTATATDGNGGTPTDGNGGTPTDGNGGTPAGTDPPSATPEPTVTPGGDFEADITFESCTEFTVDAESYNQVWVNLADTSEVDQFDEGYEGENSFEASGPIVSIEVFADAGRYSQPNPDSDECSE